MYDGEYEPDSMDVTAEMALRDALEDWKDNMPPKMMIIGLWDEPEGHYHPRSKNVGMRISEIVALLEYIKHDFLNDMQGIDAEEEE